MTASHPKRTLLGIDTGGTYTDAVLIDGKTRLVLQTAKALTTHHDLLLGILEAIDALQDWEASTVAMVSLSTTLSTNAIVEGRGRRAALILIGYDQALIESYHLAEQLAADQVFYVSGGHDVHGEEVRPLDVDALVRLGNQLEDQVDAVAISGYFSPFNPDHEIRAYEALRQATSLPMVLGHELSSKLNSIRRATTAAVNASLISVASQFVHAARAALSQRGIAAPLMVVKGDGTLINAHLASRRPVETIISGPAASAMGAKSLAERPDAVVVDVGGTTTDIIQLREGETAITDDGALVGRARMAVRAARIRTIGLGGDSQIILDRHQCLHIGPLRVIPLSQLACGHSRVRKELTSLADRPRKDFSPDFDLEYWMLGRRDDSILEFSASERAIIDSLKDGPRSLSGLLEPLGAVHPIQLPTDRLFNHGILVRAALTPTDLLHSSGRYHMWDNQAARSMVRAVSKFLEIAPQRLVERAFEQIADVITREILAFLLGTEDCRLPNPGDGADGFLEVNARLRFPIVGIGAPAPEFLAGVARKLHAQLVLPRHYPVANAVGTVSSGIIVSHDARVSSYLSDEGFVRHFVATGSERRTFADVESALAFAREAFAAQARREAIEAGAEDPEVIVEGPFEEVESYLLKVRAAGNPPLGSH
jgi:N-methylhydantoinase A/oxoprolinase/acetone carboxylase beta subunit